MVTQSRGRKPRGLIYFYSEGIGALYACERYRCSNYWFKILRRHGGGGRLRPMQGVWEDGMHMWSQYGGVPWFELYHYYRGEKRVRIKIDA